MAEPRIQTILDLLEGLRGQQGQGYAPEPERQHVPINVWRASETSVDLAIALPGVEKERISIKVEDDNPLNITVIVAPRDGGPKYSTQEFEDFRGGHEERIKLPLKLMPNEAVGDIKPHYLNGVLYVHATKKSTKKPSRVLRVE